MRSTGHGSDARFAQVTPRSGTCALQLPDDNVPHRTNQGYLTIAAETPLPPTVSVRVETNGYLAIGHPRSWACPTVQRKETDKVTQAARCVLYGTNPKVRRNDIAP